MCYLWNVHKPIWTGCLLCGAILALSVYMYMFDSKASLDEQHTTVDIIQWQVIWPKGLRQLLTTVVYCSSSDISLSVPTQSVQLWASRASCTCLCMCVWVCGLCDRQASFEINLLHNRIGMHILAVLCGPSRLDLYAQVCGIFIFTWELRCLICKTLNVHDYETNAQYTHKISHREIHWLRMYVRTYVCML